MDPNSMIPATSGNKLDDSVEMENSFVCRNDAKAQDVCGRMGPGCGHKLEPAKRLLISHPDAAEASRPDCYTLGLKGYGRPHQHPLYQTSNAVYGRLAAPPGLNKKRFPRNTKFTTDIWKCGIYEDMHMCTEVESDALYVPRS
ncbi:uncharacterized protein LOC131930471 [Physella acuta]|uniref:uncharacterized protein LOC131930471 n=1 Tax=Physella acuta TaxID=109671 RepID=UPI0027DDB62B|nr:uncharacterized protein LOC131930471 [Physella acuta]